MEGGHGRRKIDICDDRWKDLGGNYIMFYIYSYPYS